jgi:hypothetical protein
MFEGNKMAKIGISTTVTVLFNEAHERKKF